MNNITVNSSSQVRILNYLHLLPCPQPLTLSSNIIPSAFGTLVAQLSVHCFCFNPTSFCQKTDQLTETVAWWVSLPPPYFPQLPVYAPLGISNIFFRIQSYSGYIPASEPPIASFYSQTQIPNPFNGLYDHQILATTKPSSCTARLFPSHILSFKLYWTLCTFQHTHTFVNYFPTNWNY